MIDKATGTVLEYNNLKIGPDGEQWVQAAANEIGCLTQGVQPHMPNGTETMIFIQHTAMPKDHKATYLHIVAALKPNKAEKCASA